MAMIQGQGYLHLVVSYVEPQQRESHIAASLNGAFSKHVYYLRILRRLRRHYQEHLASTRN